ncbi:hypothetical protein GCM10007385_14840 [Tateyamaria omphalii]|nr:hypothetical protein GCM10007385_14840 [Tateyamaria omphalii]
MDAVWFINARRQQETLDLLFDLAPALRDPFAATHQRSVALLFDSRDRNGAQQPSRIVRRQFHRIQPVILSRSLHIHVECERLQ